jgi:D-proline reductase (dithiol) PrdB
MTVAPYRFVDKITRKVAESWIAREPAREPVWTPLPRPLSECRVACVSTAAVALRDDEPFDQAGERRDPWWGDPSLRWIPRDARGADIRCWHMHIDGRHAEADLDCVLPLARLAELAAAGEIGEIAPRHASVQGYQVRGDALWEQTAPELARGLVEDGVDVVLLVPV